MLEQSALAGSSTNVSEPTDAEADAATQVLPVITAMTEPPPSTPERSDEGPPAIGLSARPLVLGALVVALTLAALHFGAVAINFAIPAFRVPEAVKLNNEPTVATWFSAVVDLVNAVLLAVLTATAPARERWRWAVTTAAVLCVSIDEISGFHEDLSWVLHTSLHTGGLLTYAWVVPALVFVVGVGLLCAKIILPRPGGWLVLIGGVVYVAGAAGVETIEGWWVSATGLGGDNTVFLLLNGVEETMEMIGSIVTMAGLLRMASGLGVRLLDDRRPPRAER